MGIELLAPAGSYEALRNAIYYGADAIYFGLKGFNARQKVDNVDIDMESENNIEKWIDLCKQHNKKAYIATNTLIKDNELEEVVRKIVETYNAGADAFIVQDIGLLSLLNKHFPQIPIHASTQMGIGNIQSVELLKNNFGNVKRIILPRECNKDDIKPIVASRIEVEMFCHGALCVGFSGGCYLSSFVSGNSGNRGHCLQLCRAEYQAEKDCQMTDKEYYLSPRDLCLLNNIEEIKASGITSLKIEGRGKRPEYVGQVVKCYRKALDGEKPTKQDIYELKCMYNRGDFTKGYYGDDTTSSIMNKDSNSHDGVMIGTVSSFDGRNQTIQVLTDVKLGSGDGFKVFRSNQEVCGAIFSKEVRNNTYELKVNQPCFANDVVNITTSAELLKTISSQIDLTFPVQMYFSARTGEFPTLRIICDNIWAFVKGETPCEKSITSPVSKEQIEKQLIKLGDTPFRAELIDVDIAPNLFIPVKSINDIRREAVKQLLDKVIEARKGEKKENISQDDVEEAVKNIYAPPTSKSPAASMDLSWKSGKVCVVVSDMAHLYQAPILNIIDEIIFSPQEIDINYLQAWDYKLKRVYLELPYFLHEGDIREIKKILPMFRGIASGGLYAKTLAEQCGIEYFAYDNNACNQQAIAFWGGYSKLFSLSKELTIPEIGKLSQYSTVCQFEDKPYIFTFGKTKLMELHHCPYQNVGDYSGCDKCDYKGYLKYKDKIGKKFSIERKKFKSCVFELYNADFLNVFDKEYPTNCNYIVDSRGLTSNQLLKVVDNIKQKKIFNLSDVEIMQDVTHGHFYRGIK